MLSKLRWLCQGGLPPPAKAGPASLEPPQMVCLNTKLWVSFCTDVASLDLCALMSLANSHIGIILGHLAFAPLGIHTLPYFGLLTLPPIVAVLANIALVAAVNLLSYTINVAGEQENQLNLL
jgi:hypothetical protein